MLYGVLIAERPAVFLPSYCSDPTPPPSLDTTISEAWLATFTLTLSSLCATVRACLYQLRGEGVGRLK